MPLFPLSSSCRCDPKYGKSNRFETYLRPHSPDFHVKSRWNPSVNVSASRPLTDNFAEGPRVISEGSTDVAAMKTNVVSRFSGTAPVFHDTRFFFICPGAHQPAVMNPGAIPRKSRVAAPRLAL